MDLFHLHGDGAGQLHALLLLRPLAAPLRRCFLLHFLLGLLALLLLQLELAQGALHGLGCLVLGGAGRVVQLHGEREQDATPVEDALAQPLVQVPVNVPQDRVLGGAIQVDPAGSERGVEACGAQGTP